MQSEEKEYARTKAHSASLQELGSRQEKSPRADFLAIEPRFPLPISIHRKDPGFF